MERKSFRIFNDAVWLTLGFLILQQLISASSTIWITRLIAHIQAGAPSFIWLGLYLTSLFLHYLPGSFALVQKTKAKYKADVQFVELFATTYRGRIMEWLNRDSHNSKSSILTGEANQTFNEYLDFIYNVSYYGFHVLFNLIILAFVIQPYLLITYLFGVLLTCIVLKWQKEWKRILTLRAQQGRVKWIAMMLKAWDNVLLNNRYNLGFWHQKIIKRAKRLIISNVRLEGFSQGVSVIMAFLLLAPSFFLICYTAIGRVTDLVWLAMMVVTLPSLFDVMSYSYELLLLLSNYPMQKARLETVLKLLDPHKLPEISHSQNELENRIQWEKLVLSKEGASLSAKHFLSSLPSTGRITLRGENGCGKTSFLLLIKMVEGEAAFYLPPKHDLVFQLSKNQLSTGQLARKTLQELFIHLDNNVILLDEWDANLDRENSEALSSLIDKLSLRACVIESRHIKQ